MNLESRSKNRKLDFRLKPSVLAVRQGYTLLEVLISIAIFSGLLIISLGAVATSSGSSSRSSTLREKSQAARALIDQISDDFRLIDSTTTFKVTGFGPPPNPSNCSQPSDCEVKGFSVSRSEDELIYFLHYPTDAQNKWTIKFYKIEKRDSNDRNKSLYLTEGRNCTPILGKFDITHLSVYCTELTPSKQELLSFPHVLNDIGNSEYKSRFYGLPIQQAQDGGSTVAAFLRINISLKPFEYLELPCSSSSMPAGACYKIETTLTAGKR